jgi:hypothetical protein
VVQSPPSQSSPWTPDSLLDEDKETGWASPRADLTPKTFVFELAQKSEITSLVFDTAQVDQPERNAKDLRVEISDRQDGGFTEIAAPSLAVRKDGQKFVLKTRQPGVT